MARDQPTLVVNMIQLNWLCPLINLFVLLSHTVPGGNYRLGGNVDVRAPLIGARSSLCNLSCIIPPFGALDMVCVFGRFLRRGACTFSKSAGGLEHFIFFPFMENNHPN